MIDRHAAGDGKASCLGGTHDIERGAAGDLTGVVAPAGKLDEADVALEHDGLGHGGHAAKPEPGRDLALVHHPVGGKRRVLEVMHDERAEILGVGEHVPHHLGVGEARLAIAEGDRARLVQETDLRHLLALRPLVMAAIGWTLTSAVSRARLQDEIDKRHVVDHGIGVGHADDGGDAAGGRGAARRGERLAMLEPGLPGEHHHVDQAGGEHAAGAIDDLGVADAAGGDVRAEIGDGAVHDQHAALAVEARRRDRSAAH